MNTVDNILFNVYSYKGDKYAITYNDIVVKNNEKNIDYSNPDYNTCYALPIDKIIVTLNDEYNKEVYKTYSNTKVLWDFGDGTTSTELSAVHWYQYPGKYKIKATVYDSNLIAYESTYNTVINVYNFIPHTLPINSSHQFDYTLGDVITLEPLNLVDISSISTQMVAEILPELTIFDSNNNTVTLSTAILTGNAVETSSLLLYYLDDPYFRFKLHRFNSWQSYNTLHDTGYNIELYVEGTNTSFISHDDYIANAYSHLHPISIITDENGNSVNTVHYDITTDTEVYVKYDGVSSFIVCDKNDDNAVFAGTYDSKLLKFTDDLPIHVTEYGSISSVPQIQIGATFNTTGFKTKENVNSTSLQQLYNHVPYVFAFKNILSSQILQDSVGDMFNWAIVNTCGLSGEQYNLFEYVYEENTLQIIGRTCMKTPNGDIYPFKCNTVFTTVSTDTSLIIVDKDNNEYGNITFHINNINTIIPIKDNIAIQNVEPVSDKGGYFRIHVSFLKPFQNVFVQMSLNGNNIYNGEEYIINEYSSIFNVIAKDKQLKIFKINEGFNLTEQYKKVAQQPILQDSTMLFDGVISSIVGDGSNYTDYGSQVYEKISNYVMNTQDVDTCNITHLYDMYNKFDEYIADLNYDWPSELQRIVDFTSIKFNKLFGSYNSFSSDFDKKGYVNNANYGRNLDDEIDFNTGIIHTNEIVIAYEKFSEKYIKLNCNIEPLYIQNYIIGTESNNVSSFSLSGAVDISTLTGNTVIDYSDYYAMDSTDKHNYIRMYKKWGWKLVLPDSEDEDNYNISDYYIFYRFKPYKFTIPVKSVINWENPNNSMIALSTFSENSNVCLDTWNSYKQLYIYQTLVNNV